MYVSADNVVWNGSAFSEFWNVMEIEPVPVAARSKA